MVKLIQVEAVISVLKTETKNCVERNSTLVTALRAWLAGLAHVSIFRTCCCTDPPPRPGSCEEAAGLGLAAALVGILGC